MQNKSRFFIMNKNSFTVMFHGEYEMQDPKTEADM